MTTIRVLLIDGNDAMRAMRQQILANSVLNGHQIEITALGKLPKHIQNNNFDLIIIDAQLLKPNLEQKLRALQQGNNNIPMMVLYKRFDTVSIARKILGNPAGLLNTDNLNQITQKWLPKIFSKATCH